MDSISHAIADLNRIIRAFKKELPDNIVKSSLKDLMGLLFNLNDVPGVIKWGIVGDDFENFVEIEGQKAVLPNDVRILQLSGQAFLGDDNVKDEVHQDRVYSIGSEVNMLKLKKGGV